jgi:hypothetical protein
MPGDEPVAPEASPAPAEPLVLPAWTPGERVWFARPPGLADLSVMHARNSARPWKVWHEHYTLALIHTVQNFERHGASEWHYRGKGLLIVPGMLMLMEPGECHITRKVSDAGDFDVFQIAPGVVEEAAREAGMRAPIHLRSASTTDPVLVSRVHSLARGIRERDQQLSNQQIFQQVIGVCSSTTRTPRSCDLPQPRRNRWHVRATSSSRTTTKASAWMR